MAGGGELLRRIPRIKFPQRHPKSSPSVSVSQSKAASSAGKVESIWMLSSDVPASPKNMARGGKASLQPKRTPVTDREIEAILVAASKLAGAKDTRGQASGHLLCFISVPIMSWSSCIKDNGRGYQDKL